MNEEEEKKRRPLRRTHTYVGTVLPRRGMLLDNEEEEKKRRPLRRTHTSVGTVLPRRGMLLDLRNSVWRMPADEQLKELRATMHRLRRMSVDG
jgi:hypothetical protein